MQGARDLIFSPDVRLARTRIILAIAFACAATVAHADVTIGVAAPITGVFATLGQQVRAGAAQAVADLNRAGGVNGQTVRLEVMDDACDARTADAVANQLTGKGAVMVVGHVCLTASLAAATVYATNKIVQISPATTYPKYTDERAGPGTFRLAERDDQQGVAAGLFLASRYATRNVAVVNDDTAYGKGLADAVRRSMNGAGKREVLTQDYKANASDLSELVGRLKAASVEAVFIGGSDVDVAKIVKQMRDAGLTTQVVGGDALATDQFWQIAGAAAQGTLMSLPFDPRKNGDAAAVAKTFRDAGTEPAGYILPAYAAVRVWAAAATSAKTFAFDKVAAALSSQTFPTVLGPVRFDAKGDADLPGFVLYEWRDGRFDTLQR
jgi:branched-chain amino acid transport system substrate-binding protein